MHISFRKGVNPNEGTINRGGRRGRRVRSMHTMASLSGTLQRRGGHDRRILRRQRRQRPLTAGTLPVLNGPGRYEFGSGYLLLTKRRDSEPGTDEGNAGIGADCFKTGGAITNLTLGTVIRWPETLPASTGRWKRRQSARLARAITVNSGGVLQESNLVAADTGSLTVRSRGWLDVASAFAAYGPLTNFGTMNLTNAHIPSTTAMASAYSGGINNQGQINFYGATGDEINCTSASVYVINQGTISQRPGTGPTSINATVLTDPGTLDSQGGTLTLDGVALQSSSVLNFGLNSAMDYGSIILDASAVLSGTVSANFNGGFSPVIGDSFNVLSYPYFLESLRKQIFPPALRPRAFTAPRSLACRSQPQARHPPSPS